MEILVASDIHGRLERARHLQKAIDDLKPDRIVLLGDYLYNGPRNGVPEDYDPMAVCEILNLYAEKIIGVRGNCDSRIDESLLKFPLEDSRVVELDSRRCNLIHGDLINEKTISLCKGSWLLFGHTHVHMLKAASGAYWLNPGSISFPKMGQEPSFAWLSPKKASILRLSDYSPISTLSF